MRERGTEASERRRSKFRTLSVLVAPAADLITITRPPHSETQIREQREKVGGAPTV